MTKTKKEPRNLLALTEEELKAKPLTMVEQKVAILLLKAVAQYTEVTEVLFRAQAEELERLRKFEFDHTDHDYAKGC
jgi:hypothetical protein